MKYLVVLLLGLLAACSGQSPPVGVAQSSRAKASLVISNVYVLLEGGTIQRFPAGVDTSTPNKTKSISSSTQPLAMGVSPYNGRVAVTFFGNSGGGTIVVLNRDLSELYSFNLSHVSHYQEPLAVAYDPSGNLYVAEDNDYYDNGKVLEYYGNDTTPDAIWTVPISGGSGSQFNSAIFSIAFDSYGDPFFEADTDVYSCTANSPSALCTDTSIPSFSTFDQSEEYGEYLAQIALPDNVDLAEAYFVYGTPYPRYIKRYSEATGRWSYSTQDRHCYSQSDTYLQSLSTDAGGTQYYTCGVIPSGSGSGAGLVNEVYTGGGKSTISNLDRPMAAGAY